MARQSADTRNRIIAAAWELFYENGYDDTTVDEIVERSGTSKGSFYHYFPGKDALLGSLSALFDEKYRSLSETIDPGMNSFDKLMLLKSHQRADDNRNAAQLQHGLVRTHAAGTSGCKHNGSTVRRLCVLPEFIENLFIIHDHHILSCRLR